MDHGAPVVHLNVRGSGPTVILIHSHGYDSRTWQRVVGPLAERYTVVTVDRPGHGRSIDDLRVRRARTTTLEAYAAEYRRRRPSEQDVAEIEDSLTSRGVTDASVVGLGDGVRQLDVPDAPGLYPLTNADAAARYIADFVADGS